MSLLICWADGSDPCDLNLDLFCVELRCECEYVFDSSWESPADEDRAIIERLPEGDEDDLDDYGKSEGQRILDDLGADDGGDGGDDC